MYMDLISDGFKLGYFCRPQVARNSQHRTAVVLRLSQLQVLDGVVVTLEERTRAELLTGEQYVRAA